MCVHMSVCQMCADAQMTIESIMLLSELELELVWKQLTDTHKCLAFSSPFS